MMKLKWSYLPAGILTISIVSAFVGTAELLYENLEGAPLIIESSFLGALAALVIWLGIIGLSELRNVVQTKEEHRPILRIKKTFLSVSDVLRFRDWITENFEVKE